MSIKNIAMQWLHAKSGAVVQWAVGAVMGFLAAQAVRLGINPPPELMADLEKWLSVGGAFVVTYALQRYQSTQTKIAQKELGVKQDGWIGPITIKTMKQMILK